MERQVMPISPVNKIRDLLPKNIKQLLRIQNCDIVLQTEEPNSNNSRNYAANTSHRSFKSSIKWFEFCTNRDTKSRLNCGFLH